MLLYQECFSDLFQFCIQGFCYRETYLLDYNWGLWESVSLSKTQSTIAVNLGHLFWKEFLRLCIPSGCPKCILWGALFRRFFYFSETWVYVRAGKLYEVLISVDLLFLALLFLVLHRSYSFNPLVNKRKEFIIEYFSYFFLLN